MRIVNMMADALVIFRGDDAVLTIPPSGEIVRCNERLRPLGEYEVDGIMVPLVSKSFGELEGLPELALGTAYVVSDLAARAAFKNGRTDVFCPGDLVRDLEGMIIGCRSLCAVPPI